MSPFTEIQLITSRELRRSFRSVKGGLLAALSVAGGAGVAMLFAWLDRLQRQNLPEGVDTRPLREKFFANLYGSDTGRLLADCPYSLWMMLIATLWLGPFLVALMDFDAVSGEMQHRSVRFWTVRVRRSSYMLGKVLGAWIVVLAVTLGMNVIVWGVTMAVGKLDAGYVLGWGLRFFAVTIPISAAWCGIAMLVGSQFKSPMLSLFVICATFFGLWLVRIVSGFAETEWLAYAYPNAYDSLLLSAKASDAAKGLLGTGAIAGLTTLAGTLLFQRRDL